jgi:hypothetical protein
MCPLLSVRRPDSNELAQGAAPRDDRMVFAGCWQCRQPAGSATLLAVTACAAALAATGFAAVNVARPLSTAVATATRAPCLGTISAAISTAVSTAVPPRLHRCAPEQRGN